MLHECLLTPEANQAASMIHPLSGTDGGAFTAEFKLKAVREASLAQLTPEAYRVMSNLCQRTMGRPSQPS